MAAAKRGRLGNIQSYLIPSEESPSHSPSSSSSLPTSSTSPKVKVDSLIIDLTHEQLASEARFAGIDSSQLHIVRSASLTTRDDFLAYPKWRTAPPVIARSSFVPAQIVENLMRNKKDSALGVKYESGDDITNIEGAMHTFVTPIGQVKITGDYMWKGHHGVSLFGGGRIRRVLLCASVQLDFETPFVMHQLAMIGPTHVEGVELPKDFVVPSAEEKASRDFRAAYDEQLSRHLIYHLTTDRRLPALSEVADKMKTYAALITELEELIESTTETAEGLSEKIRGMYLRDRKLSIELLWRATLLQIRNEYMVYKLATPQGVVDIIDPPKIFAAMFGSNATLLNRLRILAYKYLALTEPDLLANVKVIAFNDYEDKRAIPLLQTALRGTEVAIVPKHSIFQGPNGFYSGPPKLALIVKNNSDAFGQNIETEGPSSSLDGAIGNFSDAAHVLNRTRSDLLTCVLPVDSLE